MILNDVVSMLLLLQLAATEGTTAGGSSVSRDCGSALCGQEDGQPQDAAAQVSANWIGQLQLLRHESGGWCAGNCASLHDYGLADKCKQHSTPRAITTSLLKLQI